MALMQNKPLLVIIGLLALILVATNLPEYWYVLVGVGLLGWLGVEFMPGGILRRVSSISENGVALMSSLISDDWDEAQIQATIGRLRNDENVLKFYVNQVVQRFVDGQSTRTVIGRIAFLRQQNEVIKVYLENFHLKGDVGRVKWEEQARTTAAKAMADRAHLEADLQRLLIEAQQMEVKIRIAEAEKKMNDLKNPPPEPLKPRNESPKDAKKRLRNEIETEISEVESQLDNLKTSKNMSEEQKRWRTNMLDNHLEGLKEKLGQYL